MSKTLRLKVALMVFMSLFIINSLICPAMAADAKQIDKDVSSALKELYKTIPAAKEFSKVAKGILVFPSIIKGGVVFAGQYGEGAFLKDGKTAGYYNTIGGSFGLQAGMQKFGYAIFFMDEASLAYLDKVEGWELGVSPTVVIVDKGMEKNLSTTTAKTGVYVFFFDQKGLMAGINIQGTKITKITPQ